MHIDEINPVRKFDVGASKKITISHFANITLNADEQVTFVGVGGEEVDVVKKDWGYYLTPSINKRLTNFNLNTFLVQNSRGNIYIMAVEKASMYKFHEYIKQTNQRVIINLSDIYCAS